MNTSCPLFANAKSRMTTMKTKRRKILTYHTVHSPSAAREDIAHLSKRAKFPFYGAGRRSATHPPVTSSLCGFLSKESGFLTMARRRVDPGCVQNKIEG